MNIQDDDDDSALVQTLPHHIIIDGSQGEGGGQILRNAIAYAALLNKSVEVTNIRAGRSKPGLRPQHMTGLRLCAEIAGGRLQGDEVGSTHVRFKPCTSVHTNKKNQRGMIVGDTKTAGSVCLLLQAALPCALFARTHASGNIGTDTADTSTGLDPIQLELRGGTNAAMAPQMEYLTDVFLPIAQKGFGLPVGTAIDIQRHGYFPKGGGIVKVRVPTMQAKLQPVSLTERGDLAEVRIRSFYAGNCPRWVAEEMAAAAMKEFSNVKIDGKRQRPRVEIVNDPDALDAASGILIVAKTSTGCILGGSALGSRKERPKNTGKNAAKEIISALEAGGCVDGWLQDQLIFYMALADGVSEMLSGCLTLHTQTAIDIAEQMTNAKFEVKCLDNMKGGGFTTTSANEQAQGLIYGAKGLVTGRHLIRCRGIGHTG